MVELTQCEANLQLVKLLQGDNSPQLPAEIENLSKHAEDIAGAHKAFNALLADLDKALHLPPMSHPSVKVVDSEESSDSSGSSEDDPLEKETPTALIKGIIDIGAAKTDDHLKDGEVEETCEVAVTAGDETNIIIEPEKTIVDDGTEKTDV